MTRFNSDGTLDTSFGSSGKTAFSGVNYKAFATDASNRIYALVTASSGTVILRYTADGKADTSFNNNGSELVTALTTFSPQAIDIQSDGKLLVAGTMRTDSGNGAKVRVYRLKTDGKGDTTFDGDGVADFNFGGGSFLTPINRDKVCGIQELSGGKILVVGGSTSWAAAFTDPDTGQYVSAVYGDANFAVARLTSTGSLDTSFASSSGVSLSKYADSAAVQAASLSEILPSACTFASDTVYLAAQNNSTNIGTSTVAYFNSSGTVVFQSAAESGSPMVRPTDLVQLSAGKVLVIGRPRNYSSAAMAIVEDGKGFSNVVQSFDANSETPEIDAYVTTSPSVALASASRYYVSGGGSSNAYNNYVIGKYKLPGAGEMRPDEFTNARANDIVRDAEGGLHLAYYDAAANVLKYAYRGPNGLWNAPVTVDNNLNAGQYVSIDVDSKNHAGIAYFDGTNGDLKLATSDGKKWTYYTVESKGSTGLYPSFQFDNTDRPTMSYYRKTGGDLRFAVMTAPGTFGYEDVETVGDVGRSNVLAASPKTGRYTIAYFDNTTSQVKWAGHQKGGKWSIKVAAQTAAGADFISMAYGYSYEPAIAYYEAKTGDLKISYFSTGTQSFTVKALATSGAQGLYTQVFFPSYYGQPAVYHYNRSLDKLVLLSDLIDANPNTAASINGVGRYLSIATDGNGVASDLAYFDATANAILIRPAPNANF